MSCCISNIWPVHCCPSQHFMASSELTLMHGSACCMTTICVAGVDGNEADELIEAIAAASCPEEAARQGRRAQRRRPHLVRRDWDAAKIAVMDAALHAKVSCFPSEKECRCVCVIDPPPSSQKFQRPPSPCKTCCLRACARVPADPQLHNYQIYLCIAVKKMYCCQHLSLST